MRSPESRYSFQSQKEKLGPEKSSVSIGPRRVVPLSGLREKNIEIKDGKYTIPLPYSQLKSGSTSEVETIHCEVVPPSWINDVNNSKFQRLNRLVKAMDGSLDLINEKSDVGKIVYRGLRDGQSPALSEPLLRMVVNDPEAVGQSVQSQSNQRSEPKDKATLFHPKTGERIDIAEGDVSDSSRRSLLILALLSDDPKSGAERLLRFLHTKPAYKSENGLFKSKKTVADTFLDELVEVTATDAESFNKADRQTEARKESISAAEAGKTIATNVVPILRGTAMEASTKKGRHSPEVLEGQRQQKTILNQQRYNIPKEKPELTTQQEIVEGKKRANPEDTRRFTREEFTRAIQEYLTTDRAIHHQVGQDPQPDHHFYALLQFQRGKYPLQKLKEFKQLAIDASQKIPSELTHEEVAILLSMEMEIRTRPLSTKAQAINFTAAENRILQIANEIHEHGYFYINSKLGDSHDPMSIHMSGGVLCMIHTPVQLQMLSNVATQVQAVTAGLQLPISGIGNFSAFSGFTEALGGVTSLGQGLSLFTQAFAFSGASLGAVFSGSERSSSTTSGGSTTKPKTPEAPTRKSKPQVIFQSSGGSGSRNTNENGKERNVTPPVMPKPKERIVKTPSLKKPEKPKSVPVPSLSRPKHRETPIFVARSASAPTVSRPITKERKSTPLIISKPKVERVPRIVLQPRIVNQSGNERKASSLTSSGSARKETVSRGATQSTRRVSEVPVATTTASFSKRLEQVFQEKQVAEVRKKQQVKPQSEMRTNVVTAPARRDIQSKPVATAHSVKETKQTPAITSSNKTAEKRTKVEQIKPTETKSQIKKTKVLSPEAEIQVQQIKAKVNIRTQEEVSVAKEVVKQKQVKEVRATQEQSIPTQANKPTAETTNENLVTITAALVGGALFESAKRIIPIQAQETVSPTLATEHTDALLTSDTQLDVVGNLLARRHAEYGQGRGGGSVTKKKTRAKTPVQTTDRVMTASMRSLPTNAMIDVSDSFNTAREVKMWAQEALAHPKLIARYYATAA
jgi:hypothetical protein